MNSTESLVRLLIDKISSPPNERLGSFYSIFGAGRGSYIGVDLCRFDDDGQVSAVCVNSVRGSDTIPDRQGEIVHWDYKNCDAWAFLSIDSPYHKELMKDFDFNLLLSKSDPIFNSVRHLLSMRKL